VISPLDWSLSPNIREIVGDEWPGNCMLDLDAIGREIPMESVFDERSTFFSAWELEHEQIRLEMDLDNEQTLFDSPSRNGTR
jgi:hypothetical protein